MSAVIVIEGLTYVFFMHGGREVVDGWLDHPPGEPKFYGGFEYK